MRKARTATDRANLPKLLKNTDWLEISACYDAGLSAEMYAIISVAIGLAALILDGQLGSRRAIAGVHQELNDLRSEMHREFAAVRKEFAVVRNEIAAVRDQVAALAECVARLEGVILGPRDFARDTGTGNTT